MRYEKQKTTIALRWVLYTLVLLVCCALQTLPGPALSLGHGDIGAVLVLPVCLAVALYEGEFLGALFGAFGGLLWDASAGRVGGYFAISMLVACFLASCLWQLYLRDSWVNFVWIVFASTFVLLFMDWLINYALRGFTAAGQRLLLFVLPVCALTALLAPPARLLLRRIHTMRIMATRK